MAKSKLRLEAREKRMCGGSVKSIALALGVSSSTVSLWCRDIKLSQPQIDQLAKNSRDPYYGKRLDYIKKIQKQRLDKERLLLEAAELQVGRLSMRERMLVGAALYWAEGFKKDKMVGFSNSDVQMVRLVIDWLINEMGVTRESLRLRVVVNESHRNRIADIQGYWSRELGVDMKYFYRPTYQKMNWKKIYEHPEEYFGVLRIRVLRSTDLLRRIRGMIRGLGGQLK